MLGRRGLELCRQGAARRLSWGGRDGVGARGQTTRVRCCFARCAAPSRLAASHNVAHATQALSMHGPSCEGVWVCAPGEVGWEMPVSINSRLLMLPPVPQLKLYRSESTEPAKGGGGAGVGLGVGVGEEFRVAGGLCKAIERGGPQSGLLRVVYTRTKPPKEAVQGEGVVAGGLCEWQGLPQGAACVVNPSARTPALAGPNACQRHTTHVPARRCPGRSCRAC